MDATSFCGMLHCRHRNSVQCNKQNVFVDQVPTHGWMWAEPGGTAIPGQPAGATKQALDRRPLFKHTINTRAQRCWASQVLN